MASLNQGDERGTNPPVSAGESAEKTVSDWLGLPQEQRLELLETAAVRVLPRLDDVEPARFLDSLRTAPRASAKLDWPEGDPDRAESFEEVLEDLMEQPIGEQKRIVELAAPRVLGGLDVNRRAKFLDDLQAKLDLAGEGAGGLSTRH